MFGIGKIVSRTFVKIAGRCEMKFRDLQRKIQVDGNLQNKSVYEIQAIFYMTLREFLLDLAKDEDLTS